MSDAGRLRERVCVVAGAMGDMGEAVAGRFAEEGAIVIGIDRRHHAVGDLALIADLTDEASVEAAYARVAERFGRLDVLYNNAGPLDPEDRSALGTSVETWNRVIASILTATWLSCKHAIPHMGRGKSAPTGRNAASRTCRWGGSARYRSWRRPPPIWQATTRGS